MRRDGLRGFAVLDKQGKINKTKNVITNSIKTFKKWYVSKHLLKKEIIPNTGPEAEIAFLDFQ